MQKFYEKIWNMKDSIVKELEKLGDYIQFLTPIVILLWIALVTGDVAEGRKFVICFAITMSIYLLLNALFNNPRPSQTDSPTNPDLNLDWSPTEGNSFPSGHTMAAMTGGVFWFDISNTWGMVGVFLGVICAFSRLAAEAHWVRDVVTSSIVSVAVYAVATFCW